MKKYLFCDLDGTLLFDQEDKRYDINKVDLDELKKLNQYDIELVIASGRSFNASAFISDRIGYPVDMIALNGVGLLMDEKEEHVTGLTIKQYMEITEEISTEFPNVSIGTLHFDGYYYMKEPFREDYLGMLKAHQFYNEEIRKDVQLFSFGSDYKIPKILFYVKREKEPRSVYDHLLEKYKNNFDFFYSKKTIIECVPKGINKSRGIIEYMHRKNVSKEQCWVAGDSNNDIDMMQCIPNSCCMNHGSEEAIKSAKYKVNNVAEVIHLMNLSR